VLVASWNVNSLRVRLPHVTDWLASAQPDVLGLQEIKLTDENFPHAELEECGYVSVSNGQPTYNGVALLSRETPIDVSRNLPDFEDDQRRVIAATYGDTRVINLYVANGQSVGGQVRVQAGLAGPAGRLPGGRTRTVSAHSGHGRLQHRAG